ncbi:hypothetical protein Tco_0544250 [Tanacetum coccineum]
MGAGGGGEARGEGGGGSGKGGEVVGVCGLVGNGRGGGRVVGQLRDPRGWRGVGGAGRRLWGCRGGGRGVVVGEWGGAISDRESGGCWEGGALRGKLEYREGWGSGRGVGVAEGGGGTRGSWWRDGSGVGGGRWGGGEGFGSGEGGGETFEGSYAGRGGRWVYLKGRRFGFQAVIQTEGLVVRQSGRWVERRSVGGRERREAAGGHILGGEALGCMRVSDWGRERGEGRVGDGAGGGRLKVGAKGE